ncbi:MAG TPA: hypothetical protein VG317_13390 [Pseudonocardiaceae bacterium]|nr:hypothetical protein [Pseudonocardiaceae bacterium]
MAQVLLVSAGLALTISVPAFAQTTATSTTTTSTATSTPTTTAPTTSPTTATLRWITVSPSRGSAGQRVSVQVACVDQAGPVLSSALNSGPLARNAAGQEPWALFTTAVVRGVRPGSYPVSAPCGGTPVSTTFTVAAPAVSTSPAASAQVPTMPSGPAQTGGGGMASQVTDPSGGFAPTAIVIAGLVVVFGGMAAVLVRLVRLRRQHAGR